jgi:transcription antitermination factor NusG
MSSEKEVALVARNHVLQPVATSCGCAPLRSRGATQPATATRNQPGVGTAWYCVTVRPGWMQRVCAELAALGYRAFYCERTKWVSHARQRRVKRSPLPAMSGYLFVDIAHGKGQSFEQVRNVYGVVAVVKSGESPKQFGLTPIDFLRRQLEGEWDEAGKTRLEVGCRVRVVEGEHDGELAVITARKGQRVTYRLRKGPIYGSVMQASLRAA